MLLLIALAYACIELRADFPKGYDIREGLKTWHFMLALSVLVLVVVRIGVRLPDFVSRIQPEPTKWQALSARAINVALYVFMSAMPILGWLTLTAEGKAMPFFGLLLPALVSERKLVSKWTREIHEKGGTIGYFLIGLHAAAALFRHYVVRANTLRRMIPSLH